MKIVFIGQKGVPTRMGGIERHVEELSIRLARDGHEVIAYTRPNYTDKNLKEYRGVRLISLPTIGTKHLDAIVHTLFACVDVTLRRKVDVIHFHSIGPSLLIWLAKLLNPFTPIVATFHSQCYYHKKWGGIARLSLRTGEYFCCKFSDSLITVSRNLAKYVEEKYKRKAIYVPNGVPMYDHVVPDKMKRWGIEKKEYLFYGGRLIRHKGLHFIIEAFNRVKTDKKLVITGDGAFADDYVAEIKKMAEGNENIIFTGKIDGTSSELAELFSNAYLYVHPTQSEGLSISLLETMSYGVPPLISDIPENLEAVGGTGFVFEDSNVYDLTEKLQYLLDNPGVIESKKEMCKKRVLENYSWEEIAQNVSKVYIESQQGFWKNLVKGVTRLDNR